MISCKAIILGCFRFLSILIWIKAWVLNWWSSGPAAQIFSRWSVRSFCFLRWMFPLYSIIFYYSVFCRLPLRFYNYFQRSSFLYYKLLYLIKVKVKINSKINQPFYSILVNPAGLFACYWAFYFVENFTASSSKILYIESKYLLILI